MYIAIELNIMIKIATCDHLVIFALHLNRMKLMCDFLYNIESNHLLDPIVVVTMILLLKHYIYGYIRNMTHKLVQG